MASRKANATIQKPEPWRSRCDAGTGEASRPAIGPPSVVDSFVIVVFLCLRCSSCRQARLITGELWSPDSGDSSPVRGCWRSAADQQPQLPRALHGREAVTGLELGVD